MSVHGKIVFITQYFCLVFQYKYVNIFSRSKMTHLVFWRKSIKIQSFYLKHGKMSAN